MVLNNKGVSNEIKEEIKTHFETNENEHTTPNHWDTVKAVLMWIFIALQACLKKHEISHFWSRWQCRQRLLTSLHNHIKITNKI